MRLLVISLILVVAACSEQAAPRSTSSAATEMQSVAIDRVAEETSRLNVWLDDQYTEQLDFSPQTKTFLGDKSNYDSLDDYSSAAEDRALRWLRQSVASMQSDFDYKLLSEDGKLSFDMWAYSLQRAEAAIPFRQHGYIFGRGGPPCGTAQFYD